MTMLSRLARLPVDPDRPQYPVPFFAAWVDGKPEFRLIDPERRDRCVRHRLCWICGFKLTRHAAFTIGPMCAVNRVSAEPPSHITCAQYAATHCPFLTKPQMRRREAGMPDVAIKEMPGRAILDNPGACLVWVTPEWQWFSDGRGGRLIQIGEPTEVYAYTQGRSATEAEITEVIARRLPVLEAECDRDRDPAAAKELLGEYVERARNTLTTVGRFA